MNYKKFTIKNYRCFSKEQSLYFGIPNDNVGSGLTYIVGMNNSGKTTLIEGITMKDNQKIRASEKKSTGPEFCLYDTNDEIKRKIYLTRPESHILKENSTIKNSDCFEIIASRRHWESNASNDIGNSQAIISSTKFVNLRMGSQQNVKTSNILKDIEKNDEKYKQFTKLVQKIIPEFTQWAVAYEDHEYIEYISADGLKHKTDFLGDGVISIIRILAHLFQDNTCGLIIDEPELSLHPLAQKQLIKLIAEYSQKRQIVISTHSPYFFSWEYIENGANLNRVSKINDTNSKINSIRNGQKYKKLVNGGNWAQPYLMDVVSKEIFFQENILFLEGQEDVGLLQKFFIEDNINLFGYGVRGFRNFELACELAKDLGILKACILIDSPKNPDSVSNENETKKILEEKYGNQYLILQWKKTDIRDKFSPEGELEKTGYFKKDGQLKSEDQLEDFYEKIQLIKKYFSKKE